VVLLVIDLAALPANSLIASGLALVEEIGWRGFLQRAKLGDTLAVLAVGVIWGVWHAPQLLPRRGLRPVCADGRQVLASSSLGGA
jgi:membrane protease YdiL (CAAX protease family)